jgi:hypothetical protein
MSNRRTFSPAARDVAQLLGERNITVERELVAILQLIDRHFPQLSFADFLGGCAQIYAVQMPMEGRA